MSVHRGPAAIHWRWTVYRPGRKAAPGPVPLVYDLDPSMRREQCACGGVIEVPRSAPDAMVADAVLNHVKRPPHSTWAARREELRGCAPHDREG